MEVLLKSTIKEGEENYLFLSKHDPAKNVLEFFEKEKDKNEFTRNFWLFLKELGTPLTGPLVPTVDYFKGFPGDFVPVMCETGYPSHITAPYFSEEEPNLECYFGFVDVYEEGVYENTRSHSFIVTDKNEIVDIQYNFQVRDFNELKENLRNYYGVHIPKSIIAEIYAREPKGVKANLSGFFKFEVFQSLNMTMDWIAKIKAAKK